MISIPETLAIAIEHHSAGQLQTAEQIYSQILAADPKHAQSWHLLGLVALQRGQPDAAISHLTRAIELAGADPAAHCNLGTALQAVRRLDEAVNCFRRALERNPQFPEACNNLGTVLQSLEKRGEALHCFAQALELKPDYAEAHNNLGSAFQVLGEIDNALACFQRAIELNPDYAAAHSNLLLALQYRPGITQSELAAAHARFEQLYTALLRAFWQPHQNNRDPDRPLRLGLVSPDFGRHAVGYFLIRACENLDAERCRLICYSDRSANDDLTHRFQAASTIWREVKGISDEELAKIIRDDSVDILFDLAGHTEGNRLQTFARKPAPIQITWAGYPGTTGLRAMDYVLADRYQIPPEADGFYCEHALRMPDAYVCYDPPTHAAPVSPLPAFANKFVTFGSFNNPAKINRDVITAWAKILLRLPQSRLVLKYRGMDDGPVTKRVAQEFAAQGVDPGRVECSGWSPHAELLAKYAGIDVALDPFPYSGGLTTCEALWMGVPVITCPGETFASRHSLSHLSNVGLTETIARDLNEYVEVAVSLATDLPRLAALRSGLRERTAASALCDGQRFADNLMHLLRAVWRQWCRAA
jgi:predicted O-linked N-acetylglucosamine transferase (SPINDLY family)